MQALRKSRRPTAVGPRRPIPTCTAVQEYASRFCEVTDAYAILSDPVARSRFDQTSTVDKERTAAAAQEIYEVIAYIRSRAAEAKSAAMSSALRGLAWLGGGSLISLLGYISAVSSGGGRYTIFWGAILFGGIQAYRGFVAYANINAKARDWSKTSGTW